MYLYLQGDPSLNCQTFYSYHGFLTEQSYRKNLLQIREFFANFLMFIYVLKRVVFHTMIRLYAIFPQGLQDMPSFLKKHYPKVIQNNFAYKKDAPFYFKYKKN